MPEVPEELDWVYRAFHELDGSRQIAAGIVGRIPFEAAAGYADRMGIADFTAFWRLIRALDAKYMEHLREEREKK